ncbi:MAG: sugar transferase [Elusimicrobia bacterium]|nr:sugar transferase [Elusimicrobiota bacterium]
MKRAFDLCAASLACLLLAPLMALVALLIKLTSRGPVLYWSDRVGKDNKLFRMPKFRTMRLDVPEVATHLLATPDRYLTPIGHLLRVTSFDELPQLYNIIQGEMSFVGPRPALHNQDDLVALRTSKGIQVLAPGLTGWAQINGRDALSIPDKVRHDEYYLEHRSFWLDVKIIFLTATQVLRGAGVEH